MSKELAYPSGIHQCIFLTALFIHPTHIYHGFYYEMNHCAYMGIALYATSLAYWANPLINSHRRTLDVVVAKSSILYHFYLSLHTQNKISTSLPIVVGSFLYYLSFYFCNFKCTKSAALCHCLLHGLVSFGASATYADYYCAKKMQTIPF